jgi:hypothetical protein
MTLNLGQTNQVNDITFPQYHFNITLCKCRSLNCCIYHLSHACYKSCPSHSPWFDHLNNIWWWVQIIRIRHLSPQLPPYQVQIFSSAWIPNNAFFSINTFYQCSPLQVRTSSTLIPYILLLIKCFTVESRYQLLFMVSVGYQYKYYKWGFPCLESWFEFLNIRISVMVQICHAQRN